MRTLACLLAFTGALTLVVTPATARAWGPEDLPNPQADPAGVCGRGGVASAVCDPDSVLSKKDADTVDGLVNFIEAGEHGFSKVSCSARGERTQIGAQLAVAVFRSMAGTGDLDARVKKFAKALHDRWGVGDAECQNGIVVVVVIDDRRVYVSTGRGVKHLLTDARVRIVLDRMKGALRMKKYGAALEKVVTDIGQVISGAGPAAAREDDDEGWGVMAFFAAIFGGIFIWSARAASRRKDSYNRCRRILSRMDNDRSRARGNVYEAVSCPICLEDFSPPASATTRTEVGDAVGSASASDSALASSASSSASAVTSGTTANTQLGASSSSQAPVRVVSTGGAAQADGVMGRVLSGETADAPNAGPPRVLPCGHKFHESCILSWAATPGRGNHTCPVCRKPMTGDDASNSGGMQPSQAHAARGWDAFGPEYAFRLRRAQILYPDYITPTMVNRWENERGSESLVNDVAFRALDPSVVSAARASGTSGSSFSYGGGSSSGGGGGGSSW